MPVCFSEKQYKMIEEFAKRNGMLNASQALEKILSKQIVFLIFNLFYFSIQLAIGVCSCLHLIIKYFKIKIEIWDYLEKKIPIVRFVIKN